MISPLGPKCTCRRERAGEHNWITLNPIKLKYGQARMWHQTSVAQRLGITYPVIQGPFGGGLSSVELAVTVSNLGGMGSFGAHQLSPEQIMLTTLELRSQTPLPFAINLWVNNEDAGVAKFNEREFERHIARMKPYFECLGLTTPPFPKAFGQKFDEQIEAVLEARPPVFSFVFGIPSDTVLATCRDRNIITVGTATSVSEALALEAAGVDCIVATGLEAGGHRPSFHKPPEISLMGTLALVQLVRAKVRCPIIAADGIASRNAIAAALALGADAVQIGTAFLACSLSNASSVHREALFSSEAANTVLTRLYTGRLSRTIANRLTQELAPFENDASPYPVQGWIMSQLRAAAIAQNRSDLISLGAGQIAPLLQHRDARTLFADLVRDTDETWQKVSSRTANESPVPV